MSKNNGKSVKKTKKIKKKSKEHIMTFRVPHDEYQFLQGLKADGISISNYIRTTIRGTQRYQNWYNMLYGVQEPKNETPHTTDENGIIVPQATQSEPNEEQGSHIKNKGIDIDNLPEGFGV